MASISLKYKSKQGNLTAPGDVDPGAMIPIATVTVGSGGASSVDFDSIPQIYEHLQIRGIARSTNSVGGDSVNFKINNDSSGSYIRHVLQGDGSTAVAAASSTGATFGGLGESTSALSTSNNFASYIMDLLDYSSTNKTRTVRVLSGYDNNGSGIINFRSNLYTATNAVSRITLSMGTSNFAQYSSFALYGIKRAGA